MNIFTKPLGTVTFEEVEAYCEEGNVETAELDYKSELPRDGLAKHIAAMSNTLGGIIILGVEEDKTGRPAKWEGVPNEGKLVDQIYQQAANVKPYPNCYVYRTTEKNGLVF
jgi:predicted HTH transcriptional regulator